jgi:hypothetical protein
LEKEQDSNYLQLGRVVFYGRVLSEYEQMFNLNISLYKQYKILDCPAGPSSFVAEASRLGMNVVGCDPLFGRPVKELVNRAREDLELVLDRISAVSHLYNWDFYKSTEGLRRYRELALQIFESDYCAGLLEKRYLKGELPKLPFQDDSFSLVLSGNLLFYYSDEFDYLFHRDSILEMLRISKEARIYPMQGPYSRPWKYFDKLLYDLKKESINAEVITVTHDFQRGVNKMLLVTR